MIQLPPELKQFYEETSCPFEGEVGSPFQTKTLSRNSHGVEFGRRNASRLGRYQCRYFPVGEIFDI